MWGDAASLFYIAANLTHWTGNMIFKDIKFIWEVVKVLFSIFWNHYRQRPEFQQQRVFSCQDEFMLTDPENVSLLLRWREAGMLHQAAASIKKREATRGVRSSAERMKMKTCGIWPGSLWPHRSDNDVTVEGTHVPITVNERRVLITR